MGKKKKKLTRADKIALSKKGGNNQPAKPPAQKTPTAQPAPSPQPEPEEQVIVNPKDFFKIAAFDENSLLVNVPKQAKNPKLSFRGNTKLLQFVIGGTPFEYELNMSNLNIRPGSSVVGTFTGKEYDKKVVATLYGCDENSEELDEFFGDLIMSMGRNSIMFENPQPRPTIANVASEEYRLWHDAEAAKWDKAVLIWIPSKAQVEQAQKDGKTGELAPAQPQQQPDNVFAEDIFDKGTTGNDGVKYGLEMLRVKSWSEEQFRNHMLNLLKHSYNAGRKTQRAPIQAVVDYLTKRSTTIDSTINWLAGNDKDSPTLKTLQVEQSEINTVTELLLGMFK